MPAQIPWATIFKTIAAAISAGSSIAGSLKGAQAAQSGFEGASQVQGASSEKAIEALMQLYGQATGALEPYAEVGPAALSELERLTYGGERPQVTPSKGGGGNGNGNGPETNRFTQRTKYFNLPENIRNALGVGSGATGDFSQTPVIEGLFNRTNASKDRATQGINDIAKLWWGENLDGEGGLSGALKKGMIGADDANSAAEFLYNNWIQSMKIAGVDPSIIQRSINTSGRGNTRSALLDWRDFLEAYKSGRPYDPLRQVPGLGRKALPTGEIPAFGSNPGRGGSIPVEHEIVQGSAFENVGRGRGGW